MPTVQVVASRRNEGFVIALFLLLLIPTSPLPGQAAADSVAEWTAWLATGTATQRMHAAGKLGTVEGPLPAVTRAVVLERLHEIHERMLADARTDEEVEEGFENFGEYYLNLVVLTAGFGAPEADRALIPAAGVSRGVQQRVARLGDDAVPDLIRSIAAGHDPAAALGTLGLVWFRADSTGTPLAPATRQAILARITASAWDPNPGHRLGAAVALEEMRDPTWLTLASVLEEEWAAAGARGLGWLRAHSLPVLEERAATVPPATLMRQQARLIEAVCHGVSSGPRRGFCQAVHGQNAAALDHLEAGRHDPALHLLREVARRADQARREGVITQDEHALIAGSARQIIERLAPG